MNVPYNNQDNLDNAEDIIERFGGIRPMASKMDIPVTTVQGWKKRNSIPANRRDDVLRAARRHQVDLSGLVGGAVNENGAREEPVKPESAPAPGEASRARPVPEAEKVVKHGVVDAGVQNHNEALLKKIREAQFTAVKQSSWIMAAALAVVVLLAGLLLWPSHKDVEEHNRQIAALKADVKGVKEDQSLLRKIIPENLNNKIVDLQEQARTIQGQVQDLKSAAESVVGSGIPLQQRLEAIEQQMESLGSPAQLTGLIQKVRTMQQSLEGQAHLTQSVSDLKALVDGMSGRMDNIDEALAAAQGEDDALGQTLEGVSPTDLKAAAYLLALAKFRDSLHRKGPFEEDLALMQKLIGEDDPELQAAITRLAPKAREGVLTPEGLKGEFKGLAGDIVVASLAGEDISVKDKARARFNEILKVEKDGELLTGTDTQATVARAQKMLDEGNIEGAIQELQALDGGAAQAAQPWIEEAQMTLLAEKVQTMVTDKVISQLQTEENLSSFANRASMENLVTEIRKLAPQRRLIRDEESGFSILVPNKSSFNLPEHIKKLSPKPLE